MIDLILLFFVISKWIYPIAKAKKKSPISWTLFTCCTWMFVEFSILAISISPTLFFIAFSKQPKDLFFALLNYKLVQRDVWGIIFVYLLAVLGGFLSSLIVRRNLSRRGVKQINEPPMPEVFI
jgi:hypothetical protein